MTIYLIRHAKAGARSQWDGGADWLRPLVEAGETQARALLGIFKAARFGAIVSSPYVRCMQTVVPLAAANAMPLAPSEALAEGAQLDDTLALFKEHAEHGAVFCSHGDVIPDVLHYFAARGTDLGASPKCEKASIWMLDGDVTATPTARYAAPGSALK